MFSTEDQDAILRFVFSREANVELALGVIAIRQKIIERIIKEFLARLEANFGEKAKKLDGSWKVVNDLKRNPFERWLMLYLTKPNWNDLYSIGLSTDSNGAKGFYLGVWENWQTFGQRFDDGRIFASLEGHVLRGAISDWWPYYIWADPYRDWIKEETLHSFVKDQGMRAVEDLTKSSS